MLKIGYFDAGVMTPEEIFMAANMVPVRLFGNPQISIDKANEHIPPTHCIWARNVFQQAINGLEKDIKGVVTSHGCDCTNREFDIWLECVNIKFLFFLNVPLKRNEIALKFYINDLKELITQIEEHFKVEISLEKLKEAIKLTNKIKKLLKELSEYRSKMLLRGSEFHELVKLAQTHNKSDVFHKLQTKLDEVKNEKPFNDNKYKKILLTGSVIDDTEFLKYLEDLGYQIVIDDICVGTRYFWDLIDENYDPLFSIANYHLTKPIPATKMPSQKRFEFLREMAKKYNIDGVISIAQKFCEPVLYNHPYMSKKFKDLGIPYLFLEVEYNRESYKQLNTRFEAFREIL